MEDTLPLDQSTLRRPEFVGSTGSRATLPRVWVLLGARTGDNNQLENLAEALGWPYELKQLRFNSLRLCPNWLLGASRAPLKRGLSRELSPPWPDLVIAGGQRSVPLARWIQRRARGQVRLVHIGRPRAPLDWFDLIVTTPQYRLPKRSNVLHNTMPLNRVPPARLQEAASNWVSRFGHLPRPWLGLLIGGTSWPYRLDSATAYALGQQASGWAESVGGSLLVSTGPRTPPAAAEALSAGLSVPSYLYCWHRGVGDNPYVAYLALADAFLVTGDSASALAEASSTGKPVTILDLPKRTDFAITGWIKPGGSARRYCGSLVPPFSGHEGARGGPLLERLTAWGLFTPPRDLTAYQSALVEGGLAKRTFEGTLAGGCDQGREELERTAERVRALLVG